MTGKVMAEQLQNIILQNEKIDPVNKYTFLVIIINNEGCSNEQWDISE